MDTLDSTLEIILVFIGVVTAWLILWARLASKSNDTDALEDSRGGLDDTDTKPILRKDPAGNQRPVKKEWEEQGITFLEWLDYSDVHPGLPSEDYYEQFKSYRPPQSTTESRVSNAAGKQPGTSHLASGSVAQTPPVTAPVPKTPHRTFSPLVRRFLDEGIHLYHFTDAANLESVKRLGLLPRTQLETKLLRVEYLSNDLSRSLDERSGLSDFIHLSFHPEHRMLKAAQCRTSGSIVVLAVSLEVLDCQGCCFTRALANASDAVRIPIADMADSDFRQMKAGSNESRKWQLLVPGHIPWRLLKVESTHERLIPLWP